MSHKAQKFITIFFVGLLLILIFFYNQNREVLAQDDETIICQNTVIDYNKCLIKPACDEEEIDIGNGRCCQEDAIDNLYEIPIGRTTDESQSLAKQIAEKGEAILQKLGYASEIDIDQLCPVNACQAQCHHYLEQENCVADDINCGNIGDEKNIWQAFPADQCDPECKEDTPKCCKLAERCLADETDPCTGSPCVQNLNNILDSIINQTMIIQEKIDEMAELEQDIEKLEKDLYLSRIRLYNCAFITVDAEQALEQGYTGLFDCPEVIESGIPIYSILDNKLQFGCYSNQYCQATGKTKSCANDFFCCR